MPVLTPSCQVSELPNTQPIRFECSLQLAVSYSFYPELSSDACRGKNALPRLAENATGVQAGQAGEAAF